MQPTACPSMLGDQEAARVGRMEAGGVVQARVPAFARRELDDERHLVLPQGADRDVHGWREARQAGGASFQVAGSAALGSFQRQGPHMVAR